MGLNVEVHEPVARNRVGLSVSDNMRAYMRGRPSIGIGGCWSKHTTAGMKCWAGLSTIIGAFAANGDDGS